MLLTENVFDDEPDFGSASFKRVVRSQCIIQRVHEMLDKMSDDDIKLFGRYIFIFDFNEDC